MRILSLILFCFPGFSWADQATGDATPPPVTRQYTRDEMFNITAEAAQKRPDVALLLKNSENWFWRQAKHVGLNQNVVVPIAAVAAPIIAHKVSTRSIHMDWRPRKNLTLRPDFDYYFNTKETKFAFTVTWKF